MFYSNFHVTVLLYWQNVLWYVVDYCLSYFLCSSGYYLVCPSPSGFWLSLWYFQNVLSHFDLLLKNHCSELDQTWMWYALDGRLLNCVRWPYHISKMAVMAFDWSKLENVDSVHIKNRLMEWNQIWSKNHCGFFPQWCPLFPSSIQNVHQC